MSWENNDAIEQHKGEIIVETTIMANLNSLKILQPGVPSSSVIYTCPRAVRLAWQASCGWICVERSSQCLVAATFRPADRCRRLDHRSIVQAFLR